LAPSPSPSSSSTNKQATFNNDETISPAARESKLVLEEAAEEEEEAEEEGIDPTEVGHDHLHDADDNDDVTIIRDDDNNDGDSYDEDYYDDGDIRERINLRHQNVFSGYNGDDLSSSSSLSSSDLSPRQQEQQDQQDQQQEVEEEEPKLHIQTQQLSPSSEVVGAPTPRTKLRLHTQQCPLSSRAEEEHWMPESGKWQVHELQVTLLHNHPIQLVSFIYVCLYLL
jgi:hypothetical protein